jgi:5'(3')-deoxyribonucleotidase
MKTLYIDMDGVIADFVGFAKTILGQTKEFNRTDKWAPGEWARLRDVPNLYRKLPKMRQADDIINLARKFRDDLGWPVYMLTAVPKGNDVPDAFHDKILWMQDYYPDIRVRFGPWGHTKHEHCNPGDILVDDRASNCEEWTQAGGRAIKVTGEYFTPVLNELYEIYIENINL